MTDNNVNDNILESNLIIPSTEVSTATESSQPSSSLPPPPPSSSSSSTETTEPTTETSTIPPDEESVFQSEPESIITSSSTTETTEETTTTSTPPPTSTTTTETETTSTTTTNNDDDVMGDAMDDVTSSDHSEQKSLGRIEGHHDNNLIVNYIPPDMYEEQFRTLFEPYGSIVNWKLVRDKATGTSLGYGFVMYSTKASAEVAIRELNGKSIRGKHLKVAFAGKPGGESNNTNVYIANISEDAPKDAIERIFGRYGRIVETNILMDKMTGKNKGIAFIKYERRSEAERAIDELNGTNPPGICSKPLTLKVKK